MGTNVGILCFCQGQNKAPPTGKQFKLGIKALHVKNTLGIVSGILFLLNTFWELELVAACEFRTLYLTQCPSP